jgi:hypothetical protein
MTPKQSYQDPNNYKRRWKAYCQQHQEVPEVRSPVCKCARDPMRESRTVEVIISNHLFEVKYQSYFFTYQCRKNSKSEVIQFSATIGLFFPTRSFKFNVSIYIGFKRFRGGHHLISNFLVFCNVYKIVKTFCMNFILIVILIKM